MQSSVTAAVGGLCRHAQGEGNVVLAKRHRHLESVVDNRDAAKSVEWQAIACAVPHTANSGPVTKTLTLGALNEKCLRMKSNNSPCSVVVYTQGRESGDSGFETRSGVIHQASLL
jgi:hypothetical protein